MVRARAEVELGVPFSRFTIPRRATIAVNALLKVRPSQGGAL